MTSSSSRRPCPLPSSRWRRRSAAARRWGCACAWGVGVLLHAERHAWAAHAATGAQLHGALYFALLWRLANTFPLPCTLMCVCTQVLAVKLPFDEAQLLRDNEAYLLRTLGLQSLRVRSSADIPPNMPIGQEVAYPGQPVPLFLTDQQLQAAAAQ